MFYAIRSRARCAAVVVVASVGVFSIGSSLHLSRQGRRAKDPTVYPKTLSGVEVTDHFARNRRIEGVASATSSRARVQVDLSPRLYDGRTTMDGLSPGSGRYPAPIPDSV